VETAGCILTAGENGAAGACDLVAAKAGSNTVSALVNSTP